MPNILDPKFKYTPSASTDVRKTFAKWQREYAKAWDDAHAENDARNAEVRKSVVRQLGRQK